MCQSTFILNQKKESKQIFYTNILISERYSVSTIYIHIRIIYAYLWILRVDEYSINLG